MNKYILTAALISAILIGGYAYVRNANLHLVLLSPTPSLTESPPVKDFFSDQGIIFKGLYTYGIGIRLDCNQVSKQQAEECEQRNKDNYFNPEKAQPIKTDLTIEDGDGNIEKRVYYDGSGDFKISLQVGYHRICTKYEGSDHCQGVTVLKDKYTDFAIPIMRQ